jgi:hypothetical protein
VNAAAAPVATFAMMYAARPDWAVAKYRWVAPVLLRVTVLLTGALT